MMLEEEMVIQDTIPHLIYEILTKYRTPQLFVPPPKIMQGWRVVLQSNIVMSFGNNKNYESSEKNSGK